MNDMSNAYSSSSPSEDWTLKTQTALASIETEKLKSEASSYAVIGGAMAYGEGALGDSMFGKVSAGAKWFCIWYAMIVPVALFWTVML